MFVVNFFHSVFRKLFNIEPFNNRFMQKYIELEPTQFFKFYESPQSEFFFKYNFDLDNAVLGEREIEYF